MPGAFVQTKAMLERAIALDPQFALPYSLMLIQPSPCHLLTE
jgi:hypothetical protein